MTNCKKFRSATFINLQIWRFVCYKNSKLWKQNATNAGIVTSVFQKKGKAITLYKYLNEDWYLNSNT